VDTCDFIFKVEIRLLIAFKLRVYFSFVLYVVAVHVAAVRSAQFVV